MRSDIESLIASTGRGQRAHTPYVVPKINRVNGINGTIKIERIRFKKHAKR